MISRWNGCDVVLDVCFLSSDLAEQHQLRRRGIELRRGVFAAGHAKSAIKFSSARRRRRDRAALRTSNADGGYSSHRGSAPGFKAATSPALSDDTANAYLSTIHRHQCSRSSRPTLLPFMKRQRRRRRSPLLPFEAQVGDMMLFLNASNGVVFDRATITAVNLPNITFDHAISNSWPALTTPTRCC